MVGPHLVAGRLALFAASGLSSRAGYGKRAPSGHTKAWPSTKSLMGAAARAHAGRHGRNRHRNPAVLAAREEPRGSLNRSYEIPTVRLRRRLWLLWIVIIGGCAVGATGTPTSSSSTAKSPR